MLEQGLMNIESRGEYFRNDDEASNVSVKKLSHSSLNSENCGAGFAPKDAIYEQHFC